jgi:hypothetical protein
VLHHGHHGTRRISHELILRMHTCVGRVKSRMVGVRVLGPAGLVMDHIRRVCHRVLSMTGDERGALVVR